MVNCTDCTQEIDDLYGGEKKYTSCIVSQYAIPTLNVPANEELSMTLNKIGAYIQELQQQIIALQNV